MRIKSLELIGFKSFHDKTKVEFGKGINAIVGPNGCGKSNIIDAIRWVLGEQSPKTLRADSMEDVISNGTDVLKPYGMAEVSMTVSNLPGLDFEDVNISRRLYRSGESEYSINGVKSRLKDITELFLDTGAGARSYSIIGQGKVEEFITAKPEDKRRLIEEVAGVEKYKTRRKETQSKIETTREHLKQLSSTKTELVRQMNSLSKQAEEAEKYKQLKNELATLEISLLNLQCSDMEIKKNELLKTKSELEDRITVLQKQKESRTKVLSEEELKSSSIDEEVNKLESEAYSVESQINEKKTFISYANKQRENIDEFINKSAKEIGSLENEKSQVSRDIDKTKNSLEQSQASKQKLEEQLDLKNRELEQLKAESDKNKTELETSKKEFFGVLDNYNSAKGTAAVISKELEEIRLRKTRTEKERTDLNKHNDNLSANLDSLKSSFESLKQEDTELKNERLQLTSSCEAQRNGYSELTRSVSDIKEKINEVSSRADVLKNIQDSYQWLPEVTRSFILNKSLNGVVGILSDFIKVPKQYEKALEAALGDKANWVVVKSSNEAIEAVNKLRSSSKGRVTFIPLKNGGLIDTSRVPGGKYQPITDLVSTRDIDLGLINSILKDIFVVPTIKEAIETRTNSDDNALYTTLEGDFIDASGAITGGFASGGVFERKREIEELQEKLKGLRNEHENKSRQTEILSCEISDMESKITSLDSLLKEKEVKSVELEKNISNTAFIINENEKAILKTANEIKELDELIKERESKALQYNSTLKTLEKDKEEFDLRFNKFEEIVKNYEDREKLIEKDITELKVQAAASDETQKSTRREITDLTERSSRITSKIDQEKNEITLKEKEKADLTSNEETTAEEIVELENKVSSTREKLQSVKEEKQKAKETLSTGRMSLSETEQELTQLRESRSSCEVSLQGVSVELDNVREKTQKINREKGTEQGTAQETSHKNLSTDELFSKYEKMKEKLDRHGLVNLLAPEQYKELEEKHDFLSQQTQDIEEALSSLKKAINKIDKESTTRFQEAFDEINGKFGEIISKLFYGGEGKLVITEPDQLLETGIEVMVKPGGKRFQSMNLLSGGEKAVSAIALIMSACLIKPVPFLLLDEIDAPLDENNTVRFTKLIQEIGKNSQVLIITHNKRTMLEVDTLTGITANRSAVSKVVSAELNVA